MPRHWLRSLFRATPVAPVRRPPAARPRLHQLEEREVPATFYVHPNFTGAAEADGDFGTAGDQAALAGETFATIQAAVDAAVALPGADTIIVNGRDSTLVAGPGRTYDENVTLPAGAAVTLEITGPDAPGSVTVRSLSSADATPAVVIEGASALTVGTAGATLDSTFAGVVSGSGGLTKAGLRALTLSGANTYTGATAVTGGRLVAANAAALGAAATGTAVSPGATLVVQANIGAEPVTVGGTGAGGIGALAADGGTGTVGGPVTLTEQTSIGGAGNLTVSGPVSGAAGLFVFGTLTLTLSGTNTFSGASTVVGGTVTLAGGAAIDDAADILITGGTLRLAADETVGTLNGTLSPVLDLQANTLTVGEATDAEFAGTVGGTGGLAKQGAGALTLSGTNTYTGPTAVNGGTLIANNPSALGTAAAGTTVAGNATLDVRQNVGAEPITLPANSSLITGDGTGVVAGATLTGDATVGGGGNLTVTGAITDGGGGFGLTKTGNGITTLGPGSASTYTGGTNVAAGTLVVDGSVTSTVTVQPAGTLGGTGTVTGNLTVGGTVAPDDSLTVTGSVVLPGTLAIGTPSDRLVVTGAVDVTGATLSVAIGGGLDPNDVILVIDNDGADAVVGTFAVVPDPDAFLVFATGGTGNDVVLVESAGTPSTVYVDDTFPPDGQEVADADPATAGPQRAVTGVTAFRSLTPAVAAVAPGGLVVLRGGTYATALLPAGVNLRATTGEVATVASLTGLAGSSLALPVGSELVVDGASNTTFGGPITGSGALTRAGTGTLTLSGTSNAFDGDLRVTGGRLNVTGPINADVTVTTPGILGGTGPITGTVRGTAPVAASGGTVSPGLSPGVLTVIGTLGPVGTLAFEVNPPAATPGTDYDRIVVNGTVNLTGTALTFSGTAGGGPVAPNRVLTLIENDGNDAIVGVAASPANGDVRTIAGVDYRLFYGVGDGNNDVVLVENSAPTRVYVNDDWAGLAAGTVIADADPSEPNAQPGVIGVTAFGDLSDALNRDDAIPDGVAPGGTVVVLGGAGTYGPVALPVAVNLVAVADPATDQRTVTLGAVTLNGQNLVADLAPVAGPGTPATPAGTPVTLAVGTITGTGTQAVTVTTRAAGPGTVTAGDITGVAGVSIGAGTGLAAVSLEDVTTGRDGLAVTAGTITLAGDITTTADPVAAGAVTLTGAVRLDGDAVSIDIVTDDADSTADGTVTVTGTVDSFDGVTNPAVNNAASLTLTAGAAGVVLDGAVGRSATLPSPALGQLISDSDVFTARAVTFTTLLSVTNAGTTGDSQITGVIDSVAGGAGEVRKAGAGVLVLTAANTYRGVTNVNVGTLRVQDAGRLGENTPAVGAETVVADGATLDVRTDIGAEPITVRGDGVGGLGALINGDPAAAVVGTVGGPVTLTAATRVGGAGTLIFTDAAPANPTGDISGAFRLDKVGAGLTRFDASIDGTYAGPTEVVAGTLEVNGTIVAAVTVDPGATLTGGGSTGAVTSSGAVAPVGDLDTGNALLNAGSAFNVTLTTPAAGGFSQLDVTGTVSLAGAVLNLSGSFVPVPTTQTQFVIIANDGDGDADNDGVFEDLVSGTFAGLPEGSAVTIGGLPNGRTLYISYAGGDGNDVVLSTQPDVNGQTVVLRRVNPATNPNQVEFSVDGAAFVQLEDTVRFNFDDSENARDNLLYLDTSNGDPIPAGGVNYRGEFLRVERVTGAAAESVVLNPSTAVDRSGVVDLVGGGAAVVDYAGTTRIDFVNLVAAEVRTGELADALTIGDDQTAPVPTPVPADPTPVPAEYVAPLAPAAAVVVAGDPDAYTAVGLRRVGAATVDTAANGGDGADTVTLNTVTGTPAGADLPALTVQTGPIAAGVSGPDAVDVAGTATLPTSLTLTVNGSISQNVMTGAVISALLTTSSAGGTNPAVADGGTVLLGANEVAAFGAANTAAGPVRLNNAAPTLTVLGVAQTGTTPTGTPGGVGAAAGSDVEITNAGNLTNTGAVTTAAAANGRIDLTADGGALTAAAAVTAGGAGGIGLAATGATNPIAVNAAVTSTSGAVGATAEGPITQTAGTFAAPVGRFGTSGRLTTVSVGGQDLGGFNAVGRFDATNTGGQDLTLINTAADLGVDRVSQGVGGNVAVTNVGGLTVAAAGVGVTAAGGNVALTAAGFDRSPAQTALPAGAAPLTVADVVTTTGGGTIGLLTTGEANPIAVDAGVTTDTGAIGATAAGPITQTGGFFGTVERLTTVSVGGQDLDGVNNAVGRFDGTNAGGSAVELVNTIALDIDGIRQVNGGAVAVTNAGGLTVAAPGGGAIPGAGAGVATTGADSIGLTTVGGTSPIAVNAAVTTGAGTIAATATGSIGQGAGGLFDTDGLLRTSSTGGQNLRGANTVGSLAATNTGDEIALANAIADLQVVAVDQNGTGAVNVQNAGGLTVSAALGAAGGVSAEGGDVALAADGGRVLVANTVATVMTGRVVLVATGAGNGVALNAGVGTGTGEVSVTAAAGAITQGGGGVSTGGTLLTSSVGGTALGGSNAVRGFYAANSDSGALTLTNGVPLDVTGVFQNAPNAAVQVNNTGLLTVAGSGVSAAGGAVGLAAAGGGLAVDAPVQTTGAAGIGLTTTGAGAITLTNGVSTGTGTIDARAAGAITQTGGALATGGQLATTSAGGQTLTGSNQVRRFAATNTGSGAVALTNAAADLAVDGVSQSGGGAVSVTNGGGVTVGGAVTTDGGAATLTASGGGLAVNAGVTAGAVTGNATGGIAVNAAVTAAAGVALASTGGGLTVGAAVAGGAGGVSGAAAGAVDVTAAVTAADAPIRFQTGGNFTASGSGRILDAGTAGTIQIVPDVASGGETLVKVAAEVQASVLTIGGATNLNPNDIQVAVGPTLPKVVVIGNSPTPADVAAGRSRTGDGLDVTATAGSGGVVNLITVRSEADGFAGTYQVTYPNRPATVVEFSQIEGFRNLGFRAAVVQTADDDYSIRLQRVQLDPQAASVRGAAIETNPFVVSPRRVNGAGPYSAPSTVFADVNGDGTQDLIIANGANTEPLVTIVDGTRLFPAGGTASLNLSQLRPDQLVAQFYAFVDAREPASQVTFLGGLTVAAADFNGDGKAEVLVGAGVGGGPRVQMYHYAPTGSPFDAMDLGAPTTGPRPVPAGLGNLFAFESTQRGGVTVATGDVDNDQVPDLVVGAGVGGGPRVKVYSGASGRVVRDFFAYDSSLRDGVRVAAGNFNNAGGADILTGPGFGGAPHIKVFDGDVRFPTPVTGLLADFFALGFDPLKPATGLGVLPADFNGVGGVAFGAPRLTAATGQAVGQQEILVSSGPGRPLVLRGYRLTANQVTQTLADTLSTDPAVDGYYDLFNALTNESLPGGLAIPVPVANLFFGGSVSGVAVRPTQPVSPPAGGTPVV